MIIVIIIGYRYTLNFCEIADSWYQFCLANKADSRSSYWRNPTNVACTLHVQPVKSSDRKLKVAWFIHLEAPPLPSQVFYHYNLVQQLKTLYDGILRPELLREEQETAVPPEPLTKAESKGGKKGEEKGGGGKKDRASKERKEAGTAEGRKGKGKEEPSKEGVVDVPGMFVS